jgi:mRNA-degrading endonuclease YafQ of YafQ-DinJ toxin-antitoxin module
MDVSFSSSFRKSFKKRIKETEIEEEFWLKLALFIQDPFNSALKTH